MLCVSDPTAYISGTIFSYEHQRETSPLSHIMWQGTGLPASKTSRVTDSSRPGRTTQWLEMPSTKLCVPSSIPRNNTMEGENLLLQVVLWSLCSCAHTRIYTHTHIGKQACTHVRTPADVRKRVIDSHEFNGKRISAH